MPTVPRVSTSNVTVLPINAVTNIVNVDLRSAAMFVEVVKNVMMDHCFRYQINLDLEPTQSLYVVKDSGACLLVVHVCRTVDVLAVLLYCLLLAMLFRFF